MLKKLRTFLIILLWLSLGLAPLALLSYACYAGLCGGAEAAEIGRLGWMISYFGYFSWIYPIVVFACLYASYVNKERAFKFSIFLLILPLFLTLPLIYIQEQTHKIHLKHEAQQTYYYSIHANDFVCTPHQFIRISNNDNPQYSFFESSEGPYGEGWAVSVAYSTEELLALLKNKNISLSQCKTKAGKNLVL
ncbi:Uncharacterised protein (plasmid) [Legionella adelaidensis]|uniref:Uncharacterized protein n=2 Tax=Legionella adelaidensis TaxID=45056 RepID=A0A0W0R141_9GAMM|nr:hypothetical protein Lade_2111 [Legionella adelaidensis]VEH86193.1 Uncharacterised protein [Legionella adelaidensis]